MPVMVLGIGVFAFVAGLVMIGFGIPINEFSFGNTLISAGTTASVGGLVIIAIGIAVGQLRRIAGMLADPQAAAQTGAQSGALARHALPEDDEEHAAAQPKGSGLGAVLSAASAPAPQGGRGPQRRKERPLERPAPDPFALEPEPAPMMPAGERPDQFAPSLRNPDEASLTVEDDVSLSPRHPQPAAASAAGPAGSLDRTSDSFDWRVPPAAPGAPGAAGGPPPLRPQPANFDAMWPAEGKPTRGPAAAPRVEQRAEPKADAPAREAFPPGQPAKRAEPEKPRSVAILKSGVVDGMGYTLYVDGSIEAELPQGTLRFASINELRSHLEKNS